MKKVTLFTLSLLSALSFAKAGGFDVLTATDDQINNKISRLSKRENTCQVEIEFIEKEIKYLGYILTNRMLPENTPQEKLQKASLTEKAFTFYFDNHEHRKRLFKAPSKKEELKSTSVVSSKKEELVNKKEELLPPPLAPNITWDFYINELAIADDSGVLISNGMWEFFGDAFGWKLMGREYKNLPLEACQKNAEIIDLKNEKLHSDLKLLAAQKPDLIGRYAVAYRAKGIDAPCFLVFRNLIVKTKK